MEAVAWALELIGIYIEIKTKKKKKKTTTVNDGNSFGVLPN